MLCSGRAARLSRMLRLRRRPCRSSMLLGALLRCRAILRSITRRAVVRVRRSICAVVAWRNRVGVRRLVCGIVPWRSRVCIGRTIRGIVARCSGVGIRRAIIVFGSVGGIRGVGTIPRLVARTELAAWFELAARSVLFFVAFAGRSLWAARVLLAFPAFGPRPPAAAPARSEPDLACTTARSLNAPGRGVAATAGLP